MKAPAFQFYVKDWRNNLKLRRCSEAARGAWIDILCILHDSEEYGVARMPLAELVKAAGVKMKSAVELVDKGVLKGGDRDVNAFVFVPKHARSSGNPVTLLPFTKTPLWYSSRMVRDEYLRQRRGAPTRFTAQAELSTSPNPSPMPSPIPRSGEGSGDGPAFASAVDISSTGDRYREAPVDNSARKQPRETASIRKARQTHEAHVAATAAATPPPGGSVAAFVKHATGKPPKPGNGHDIDPNDPPAEPTPKPEPTHGFHLGDDLDPAWRSSSHAIDEAGKALGMQRLAFEPDPDYVKRIEKRIALDNL